MHSNLKYFTSIRVLRCSRILCYKHPRKFKLKFITYHEVFNSILHASHIVLYEVIPCMQSVKLYEWVMGIAKGLVPMVLLLPPNWAF